MTVLQIKSTSRRGPLPLQHLWYIRTERINYIIEQNILIVLIVLSMLFKCDVLEIKSWLWIQSITRKTCYKFLWHRQNHLNENCIGVWNKSISIFICFIIYLENRTRSDVQLECHYLSLWIRRNSANEILMFIKETEQFENANNYFFMVTGHAKIREVFS